MQCSVEPRDTMYVKRYGFLSFTKSLSSKYNKRIDRAKKSATDALQNCSKRVVQKNCRSNK